MDTICPTVREHSHAALVSPTALFCGGVFCLVFGGLLRMWCYRTLKGYFTYEVTLSKDHELVTQGPYAYVRHPSYTAILLMILGTQFVCFTQRSLIAQCETTRKPFQLLVYFWWFMSSYTLLGLYKRGYVEDKQLLERFGQVWLDYKTGVPYMYLPFLL